MEEFERYGQDGYDDEEEDYESEDEDAQDGGTRGGRRRAKKRQTKTIFEVWEFVTSGDSVIAYTGGIPQRWRIG